MDIFALSSVRGGLFQIARGRQRDDTALVADGAVKMINHAVPFQHPWLVRVSFVKRFGWFYEMCAIPFRPVNQIIGARKRVERLRLPARAEIKHRPYVADFHDLRIAADAIFFDLAVDDDRVRSVTAPGLEVTGNRHADLFKTVFVFRVVKHHERPAERLGFVMDDLAFVKRLGFKTPRNTKTVLNKSA